MKLSCYVMDWWGSKVTCRESCDVHNPAFISGFCDCLQNACRPVDSYRKCSSSHICQSPGFAMPTTHDRNHNAGTKQLLAVLTSRPAGLHFLLHHAAAATAIVAALDATSAHMEVGDAERASKAPPRCVSYGGEMAFRCSFGFICMYIFEFVLDKFEGHLTDQDQARLSNRSSGWPCSGHCL